MADKTKNKKTGTPKSSGLFIALFLSLAPVLLWFFVQPITGKFSSPSAVFTSLGQITGLAGMAMMSVVIILSARPVFMDKLFHGLDNLYKVHRELGVAGFLLILAHPLLLALAYLSFSNRSAALFLLPNNDWVKNFGILAALIMMVLVVITVFAKFKYQVLKFSHQIFGAAFLFSVIHTLFVRSDVSRNFFIHWYMLGLMALGLTAFSYKTLLGKFLVKKHVYFVKEVNQMPDKITEVVMIPQKEQLKYFPGQFIFISFRGSGISPEQHPFTITSSPNAGPEIKILVKALGDYTSQIMKLPIGCGAEIEGPFGSFSYSKIGNKNQLWIAGGSGIAPFISMARDINQSGQGYKIDLYYCANSGKDLVCCRELSGIAPKKGELKLIPFCQDEKGFLNAEKIIEQSGQLAGKDIFLCGPPAMIKSLKKQFAKMKIPKSRIHSEEFKLL